MFVAWTDQKIRFELRGRRVRERRWLMSLLVLTLVTHTSMTVRADSYDEAWQRVVVLETEGELEAAIAELEHLIEAYPQDYVLALEQAWLQFQLRDYRSSEAAYRRAAQLSRGSLPANLGLAWSLIHQGELEGAAGVLDRLVVEYPENGSIQEALAYADSPPVSAVWSAWFAGSFQDYGNLASVSWGRGLALGTSGFFRDRLLVAAHYRFTRFGWEAKDDEGAGSAEWNKHEVFLNLGLIFPSASVTALYGRLLSTQNNDGDAHVVGLSTRFSLLGELRLDGALGVFDDSNVYQLTPSWSIAVTDVLRVRPTGTLQVIDDELLWSGGLDLVAMGAPGELSLGAWTGEQERRIDFDIPTVYDLGTPMSYGAAIDGRLDFEKWSLSAGYELAAVTWDDSGATGTELVHWFGLGVVLRLP